jgi:starch synthase
MIEKILAPLCYHENAEVATRAARQYGIFVNRHGWDVSKAEVVTADGTLTFAEYPEHVLILTAPCGSDVAFSIVRKKELKPASCGFYDYCYARISRSGAIEINWSLPIGRYIVIAAGARKEIIHELPAFDEKGPLAFSSLVTQLDELVAAGVTAVHVAGAIERESVFELTAVTDHVLVSKAAGGLDQFKAFCERAKTLGLRVLVDFIPLASLASSSKKYTPFSTLTVDARGKHTTAEITGTDLMLLNYRSVKFWDLLADEAEKLVNSAGITGFYLGDISHWDFVVARNLSELKRRDPDGTPHYQIDNVLEGTIVSSQPARECGFLSRGATVSPFFTAFMRRLWAKCPSAFVWIQCDVASEALAINSGILPANYSFRTVYQGAIDRSVHCEDVDWVNSNEGLISFYEARARRTPKNSFAIAPFGALADGPFNIPTEGLPLAVDVLFYLTDVPLISGCLDTSLFDVAAYAPVPREVQAPSPTPAPAPVASPLDPSKDATEAPAAAPEPNPRAPTKWWTPRARFVALLKSRALTRTRAEWVLSGDVQILPVSYDSHPMRAILAIARVCPASSRCALICTSYYKYNLIYEVSVRTLAVLKTAGADSVLEVRPLLSASGQSSYYAIPEVTELGGSLFLDLPPFQTALYELAITSARDRDDIRRLLMQEVLLRLERAIKYVSNTVLCNNLLFNSILETIDRDLDDDELGEIVRKMPASSMVPSGNAGMAILFRQALYLATRNQKIDLALRPVTDEAVVASREAKAISVLQRLAQSRLDFVAEFGRDALSSNAFGPIYFVAPELGPFSKVGGLSTMVWELAKELQQLGLDIHCVSPYYNVSPKGETDYLKKWGIKYLTTIRVYCPDEVQIGIHQGIVDGVKCWFLHHYTFFAAPYQTGSTTFRLQLLVLMAKASLELCCQTRIIPSLVISNDWMTGLVPAVGRKLFGSAFDGTKFLHIFHNLGVGYAGKLWPPDGDVGAYRYIHQLPDELLVDPFDRSFDPSRCALLSADQWATVSKRYRDDLCDSSPYKDFLRSFPHPFAYSNGIRIAERQEAISKLGMTHDEAKRAVQQKYFGAVDEGKCLLVFIGRIVEQKGVYLIIDSFEQLHAQYHGQLQFIVGGQAAPDDRSYGQPCTHRMWDLKQRFPQVFWADPSQFFSDGLLVSHAADFVLVPSLFEPSGIVQQEAFASGTPVIAFRTGGLADTVFEFNRETRTGNGFLFLAHHHHDFVMAVQRAIAIYYEKELYWRLRENAFKSTLSTVTVARAWAREFGRLFMKIFDEKEAVRDDTEKK